MSTDQRMFPIQYDRSYLKPYPNRIPWSVAKLAFDVWAARYGCHETMEHFAGRGGFGPGEMDMYLPGWLERVDENVQLREEVKRLQEELRIEQFDNGVTIPELQEENKRLKKEVALLRAALRAKMLDDAPF